MSSIILSILSGAVGGALVNALINYLSEKHARKVNYLRDQIDKFYGPLYFILISSESLFELSKEIIDAGEAVYTNASENKMTEDRKKNHNNKMLKTFVLSNEYAVDAIKINNEKIFNIVSNNYSYMDFNDIDVVKGFVRNYSRLQKEYLETKPLPLEVHRIIGEISGLQACFKNTMMKKFNAKKQELGEPSFIYDLYLKIKKLRA